MKCLSNGVKNIVNIVNLKTKQKKLKKLSTNTRVTNKYNFGT
jgi:hypothetical protein